jgi:two-component sensor histidine kinase
MTAKDDLPVDLTRLHQQRRAIEALSRIGMQAVSPAELMQYVVAQVACVTGIDHVKILRYRRERGDLLVEAGVGWKAGVVGNAVLAADFGSPAGRAVQTGGPVAIGNLLQSREFRYPDLLHDHGIVSLVNVPVMINGQTWGVLEVDHTESIEFDDWDLSFLTITANLMGACLAQRDATQKGLDATAEIARQRAQFDTMMRELQHRTKNNLQMIVSFLTLRTRELPGEMKEVLNSVIGRVQAVALAHDQLSGTNSASTLPFDEYLRSLCANIAPQQFETSIEVEAEPITISLDRAVPAGLVVNELVTNSIKYAFGNGGGMIKVHVALASNASQACISVMDDGKGMKIPPKRGLGLTLIENLARQIQGAVEYVEVDKGTKTVLCFPVALHHSSPLLGHR